MAASSEESKTTISADAALNFVDSYYRALESNRATIASFYMKPVAAPDGKALGPSIVYNGISYGDGNAIQDVFFKEMPPTHFEIQSVNSHCLNPIFVSEGIKGGNSGMSILVSVSGSVRFDNDISAPSRGFSETFVLIPNPAAPGRHTRGKPVRDYLVQTQAFRLVS